MSIMAKTPSGYKKIGSAYLGERPVDKVFNANGDVVYALQRELTGVPPLLFKGKEQSELLNYRIYGDTVDGESVGDRTANLIQGSIKNANIGNNGKINTSNEFDLVYAPVVTGESYTISNNNGTNVYAFYNVVPSTETETSYDSNRQIFSTSTITFVSPITGYIAVRLANTAQDIMINPGSTPLPYEPYGYKVPVTVEGKNLFDAEIVQGSFNNSTGAPTVVPDRVRSNENAFIFLNSGIYTINANGAHDVVVYCYSSNDVSTFVKSASEVSWRNLPYKFTANVAYYYLFAFRNATNSTITPSDVSNIMLNTGTNPLPYEPYHEPITTPIYLPEPIKMVGDEAEYIDYGEQKQHRVRKNLFDVSTITPDCYVDDEGQIIRNDGIDTSDFIKVSPNTNYTYKGVIIYNTNTIRIVYYDQFKNFISRHFIIGNAVDGETVTTPSNCEYVKLSYDKVITYLMLNSGSTSLPYEPYIENTDLDVTLPALPIIKGTNTLSVDTDVQPSRMDIKGRIKTLT